MKRKMALLLAGIMTVASLPINTFAQAPTNFRPASTFLSRSPLPAPNRTAFIEQGAGPGGQVSGDVNNNDRVNHWIEGGNFIIEMPTIAGDSVTTNGPIQFDLELQNAEWFFRDSGGPNTAGLGFSTYNPDYGTWNQANGTYTRTVDNNNERTYSMQVFSGDPTRATVTLDPLVVEPDLFNNNINNNLNRSNVNNNAVNENNSNDVNVENNDVDNSDINNEDTSNDNGDVVTTSANVAPEKKPEENKPAEKKVTENKAQENKAPENKTQENKVPESKAPQNKVSEIKTPESKSETGEKLEKEATEKELKVKEKTSSKEQSNEEQQSKTKENKVPTSVKPAGETPAKEAPKTAAVAVANIPVDAISPSDDLGFGRDAGTDDGYQYIRNAAGELNSAVPDITAAKSQAVAGSGTVGGVRGPVEAADAKIKAAQAYLTGQTAIGTVNADLTAAIEALGTAATTLTTIGDAATNLTPGANLDTLNEALDTALNRTTSSRDALNSALPDGTDDNGTGNGIRSGDIITIPLVVRTTGENVDSSIRVRTASPIPVETDRRVFAIGRQEGLTTTAVANPRTGRDRIEIPSIGIIENRIGAFPANGTFEIVAPSGYRFANLPTDAALRAEGGISTGTGFTSNLELRDNNNRILRVTYSGLNRSSTLTGSFAITGLTLVSDNPDSVREGDIFLEIRNVGTPAVVTPQRFLAGTASDYRVSMTVIGDTPQLVNGRLYGVERQDVNDQAHRAARVRVEENVQNAWWAQRSTTFTLPDQVRVRKVEFNNVRNISNYNELDGSFYNDRNRSGSASVRVNDNVITISNLETSNTARASFEMDLWLNIESGFNGNIPLTLGGSAINTTDNTQSVVVATAIDPVKLNVDVTNVRVGYQFVPVGNFSIIETVPGALKQGEQVFLTVTDNVSNDITIASGFNYDVTKGDLRIRNVRTGSNLSLNNNNNRNNVNVSFEIDRESSEASEIQFSNVQVRLGGNVASNGGHDYDLVAWGPAIAANFEGVRPGDDSDLDLINRNDFFREAGIRAKYISVQNATSTGLTNIVKATAGNPVILVNDVPYEIDTAPYVSPRSDSMMVPVRFISMGLGLEPNRVIWSPDTSTVTIDAGSRILQFQTNSSLIRINNIEVPMLNANGQPVYSEVRDERAFIPIRALAEALDVNVSWDPTTATATFDPTRRPDSNQSFSILDNQNATNNVDNNNGNNGVAGNSANYQNGNTNGTNGYNNNATGYSTGYQNGTNGYQSETNGYTNGYQNGTNGYTNGNQTSRSGYTNGYQNGISSFSNGMNNMNNTDTRYQGEQVRNRGLLNRAGRVQQSAPTNYNTTVNR